MITLHYAKSSAILTQGPYLHVHILAKQGQLLAKLSLAYIKDLMQIKIAVVWKKENKNEKALISN